MPEITRCRAADAVDEVSVPCVIAGETPSAMPGCRRCEMYQAVEAQYTPLMSQRGQTWIPIGQFAAKWYPNQWLRDRRFTATCRML
jgi:hypothetical protein